MNYTMSGKVETKDYEIKLKDVEKIKYSKDVQSQHTEDFERDEDGSIKSNSEYKSKARVTKMALDVEVNFEATIVERDGEYFVSGVTFTSTAYEFYEDPDILYLVHDIFSDIIPKGVNVEIELYVLYNLKFEAKGGEGHYQ